MNEPVRRYSVPEPLLQAVVNVLNMLPAGQVRSLLNQLEAECVEQDQPTPARVVKVRKAKDRATDLG
jgi:hypothetical protein